MGLNDKIVSSGYVHIFMGVLCLASIIFTKSLTFWGSIVYLGIGFCGARTLLYGILRTRRKNGKKE